MNFIGNYRKYDDDYIKSLGDSYDEEIRGQVFLGRVLTFFNLIPSPSLLKRSRLCGNLFDESDSLC